MEYKSLKELCAVVAKDRCRPGDTVLMGMAREKWGVETIRMGAGFWIEVTLVEYDAYLAMQRAKAPLAYKPRRQTYRVSYSGGLVPEDGY